MDFIGEDEYSLDEIAMTAFNIFDITPATPLRLKYDNIKSGGRVHNWHSYVRITQKQWNTLNDLERLLYYVMGESLADREEWD